MTSYSPLSSSVKPFGITFLEVQQDKNNLWVIYLPSFSLDLSDLNVRYFTFFGWVFALLVGLPCNGSVTWKMLEPLALILICRVSCSSQSLLFGRFVLKKSTWKLLSSERLRAKKLPLASLVVIIYTNEKKGIKPMKTRNLSQLVSAMGCLQEKWLLLPLEKWNFKFDVSYQTMWRLF